MDRKTKKKKNKKKKKNDGLCSDKIQPNFLVIINFGIRSVLQFTVNPHSAIQNNSRRHPKIFSAKQTIHMKRQDLLSLKKKC